MKNIQNLISYKNVCIDFCRQIPPSLQNDRELPRMVSRNFFFNEEHPRGFPASKYTHSKRKFYGK